MPPRSKVSQLPPEIRAELEQRLIASGFSGYEDLEAWLETEGFEIGKSSLQRDGSKLQRRIDAIKASTDAARTIAEAAPDDEGHLSGSVINMVQSDIFDVLVALQEAEDAEPVERIALLGKAAKAVAELSRASVNQKKWSVHVREQALKEAAQRVEQAATSQGMGTEQVQFWRQQVLAGI